jgi:GTPase SAR1 family protein
MPDNAASKPVAPGSLPKDALRIVLFGMPGAGKSSLLGALCQAAQTQEYVLNAHLNDLSHGLEQLRHRLYEEQGRPTAEEVVPYPVDFEPLGSSSPDHRPAVLIDCDGRVANDLLARRKALDERSPEGTLAREVLRADALVLVIDASAPPVQVESEFQEFDRFLRAIEQQRGHRTEISGLPVFLVLTKCDLLAKPDDNAAGWATKILLRQQEIETHFRAFLADRRAESGSLPFGQIDLRLAATAVKRPALAGTPARPREPYGVAELFRQSLDQAVAFRDRNRAATRRMYWLTGTAAALVLLLGGLVAGAVIRPPDREPSPLQRQIEEMRFNEPRRAADRLRGPLIDLQARRDDLTALTRAPGFDGVPQADQDYVHSRIDELSEYISYLEKMLAAPRPAETESLPALWQAKAALEDKSLEPPHDDWQTTDAATIRREALEDVTALQDAVERVRDWYLVDNYAKAHSLWLRAGEPPAPGLSFKWADWQKDADALLNPDRVLPYAEGDAVPGSDRLSYGVVLRFEEVKGAKTRWETICARLRRVRDLAAALGLTPPAPGRPAPLAIERPPKFTLDDAAAAVRTLKTAYPNYASKFVRDGLPDAFLTVVDAEARDDFERSLPPARELILQRLKEAGTGPEETPARWTVVRDWLKSDPDQLAAWRTLALLLARLHDKDAVDPVSELVAFLQQTAFTIEIKRITLRVPEDANLKVPPTAQLAIYHPATTKNDPALAFEQEDQVVRDTERRQWVYTYRPKEGQPVRPLTYRPGDDFWARLPLKDNLVLTWARSHSAVYQFQCLSRLPRLHKATEPNTEGKIIEGVFQEVFPKDGLPSVPVLLPVVPAKLTP